MCERIGDNNPYASPLVPTVSAGSSGNPLARWGFLLIIVGLIGASCGGFVPRYAERVCMWMSLVSAPGLVLCLVGLHRRPVTLAWLGVLLGIIMCPHLATTCFALFNAD